MNKSLFLLLILAACLFLLWQGFKGWSFTHDGKMHVIFCDVGQGDGVVMKSPQGRIIIFDGGPDGRLTACLSKYLPFWQRKIDVVILSHPHADHFVGFIPLLNRYKVDQFMREDLGSEQKAYQLFLSAVHDKNVKERLLKMGDTMSIGKMKLTVVGPSQELIQRTSPNGSIGESKEFASLMILIEYDTFRVLLTGDSQAGEVEEAMKKFGLGKVTVLQSPHHGSATGLSEEILKSLNPALAVISVGAKNRYGHPAPSTLSLFQSNSTPIKRTDKDGTVEIVTEGKEHRIQMSQ